MAFSLLMLLQSCCNRAAPVVIQPDKLPYKVEGTCDRTVTALEEGLRKNGVKLIVMGQNHLISIPANALFPNQSPQLLWGSYALLNDVACYLKQYRKIAVNVTTYTYKCISPRRERALTLTRSRAVADYLWSQGIDSRFIFTEGHGSDKPIVGFVEGEDNSPNSRVEITFRDAVA